MSMKTLIQQTDPNDLEFYKNLPPKICVDCGYTFIEQHESYLTKCEYCLSKEDE